MKKIVFTEAVYAIFVFLFLYTGISKLAHHGMFQGHLNSSAFPLLRNYSLFVSWFIPILELVIVLGLLVQRWRRPALWASFLLMLIFTVYIAVTLMIGGKLPCNCGGVITEMTWPQHLDFNIVLTILAAIGLFLRRGIQQYTLERKVI
jgi:uncharacterized membrane protein